MMNLIVLDSVDSTNSYLNSLGPDTPHGTVVMTREQTAGRGQRGNSWEAEPGANVTLSLLLHPAGLDAADQFIISQAVSLAIVETLDTILGWGGGAAQGRRHLAAECSGRQSVESTCHTVGGMMSPLPAVSIKWPNDIYVGHRKICGILIENALCGREISRSTVGIGLNVNQAVFRSDAPNPVSLYQLTGQLYNVDEVASMIAINVLALIDKAMGGEAASRPPLCPTNGRQSDRDSIPEVYFSRLYRREGWHLYRDNLRGVDMTARIDSVAPSGHITLIDSIDNTPRTYAFKEISFIL